MRATSENNSGLKTLPAKSRHLKKIEAAAKKKGYFSDSDGRSWERCRGCNAIIGKDYGSFSHRCPGLDELRERIKIEMHNEELLAKEENRLFMDAFSARLRAIGFPEEMIEELQGLAESRSGSYYKARDLLDKEQWFLAKIEELTN